MKWAKMDVDEGVEFGLTTMLENGRGEALFVATSLGKVDLLRDFLTKYPDMVNSTSDGRTALHNAASTGLAEPMKILLEFHAKIEQQVHTGTSCFIIHRACCNCKPLIVVYIIYRHRQLQYVISCWATQSSTLKQLVLVQNLCSI